MNTSDRLVAAAAELLDTGGEAAVTLRAVSAAIGVSHNAPYKHFDSRDALLAAVAAADFDAMAAQWARIRTAPLGPTESLTTALDVLIRFGRDHPARYELCAGTGLSHRDGPLSAAAEGALDTFAAIIADLQTENLLPACPADQLAVLLVSTTHGLVNADASGSLRPRTGWTGPGDGLAILIRMLGARG